MRGVLLLCGLCVLSAACGSTTPVAPTVPAVAACQSQNTAQLTMFNASANGFTFDVLIDNITRGTMAPGGSIPPVTLTAGVNHVIVSRITNTTLVGCSSTTSFAACSTQSLTCRY